MGYHLEDPDSVIQLCTDTVARLVALADLAEKERMGVSPFLLRTTADHIMELGIQLILEQQERTYHEHTD